MKKILIGCLFFIIFIVVGIYILLFTSIGNSILKPIIEKQMAQYTNLKITLNKLALKPNHIDIDMIVEQDININVKGDLDILSKGFNLSYLINADKLPKIDEINIDGSAKLNGKINGTLEEFNADGIGDIFGSNVIFNTKIRNYMPINAIVDVQNLSLAKVLALINQPMYADGNITFNANVTPNNQNDISGNINLLLENGTVFNDVIQKEFNLIIPNDINYTLNADFDVKNSNDILGEINFISNLVTLTTNQTSYDIKNANAKSDFSLIISDLSQLGKIANVPLKGNITAYGDVNYSQDNIKANIISDDIAKGKLSVSFDNDKLSLLLTSIKIENILNMFIQPNFANGDAQISANFTSISNKQGDIFTSFNNVNINQKIIKEKFGVNLPNSTKLNAAINTNVKDNKIEFNSKVLTSIANINKIAGTLLLNTNKTQLDSKYELEIADLSKLNSIVNQTLNGNLTLNGELKYSNDTLFASASSNDFAKGSANIILNGDKLSADLKNVQTDTLLKMVGQPEYTSGSLNLKANFSSIEKQNGEATLNISKGTLKENVIKKEFNITLPNTIYSVDANTKITKGLAIFDSKIMSNLANLKAFTGTFDIDKAKLDSKYSLNIDDLSKLNAITNQNMTGNVSVDGALTLINDILRINGISNIANGKLDFDFNNGMLIAKGSSLSTQEILKMMNYPDVYLANVDVNFNYDTKKEQGNFNATSLSGKLKDSELGLLIKPLLKVDITEEIYKTLIKGNINKQLIKFNMDMISENTYLRVLNGQIDNGNLDMPMSLRIKNRDLSATISGKSDNLKVSIDSSEYLKGKIADELLKEKTQTKIKNLLKKL